MPRRRCRTLSVEFRIRNPPCFETLENKGVLILIIPKKIAPAALIKISTFAKALILDLRSWKTRGVSYCAEGAYFDPVKVEVQPKVLFKPIGLS